MKQQKSKKPRAGRSLRDTLSSSLGVFGWILNFLISFAILYAPMNILGLGFWWNFVLFCVINALPVIGSITNIVLWIVSFFSVVSAPVDGWSIYYYIALAINIVLYVIPFVMSCITYFIEKKRGRE